MCTGDDAGRQTPDAVPTIATAKDTVAVIAMLDRNEPPRVFALDTWSPVLSPQARLRYDGKGLLR
jgi:hypothetical protein